MRDWSVVFSFYAYLSLVLVSGWCGSLLKMSWQMMPSVVLSVKVTWTWCLSFKCLVELSSEAFGAWRFIILSFLLQIQLP